MSRFYFAGVMVVAMGALLFGSCTKAAKKSDSLVALEKDVQTLAAESAKAKGKCEQFATELEALNKDQLADGAYKTREAAQKALRKLHEYPGTPEAARKLSDRILADAPRGAEWEWAPYLTAHFCKEGAFSAALQAVIASAGKTGFSPTERAELRDFALASLKTELQDTIGASVVVDQVSTLVALVGEKLVTVSDPIFVEVVRLENDASNMKSDVSGIYSKRDVPETIRDGAELTIAQKEFLGEVLTGELDKVEPLRKRAAKYVDRISEAR
jgi:hypothetical protein